VPGWGVIPTIRVADMGEALAFYVGRLDFGLERGGEGEANSALTRGEARLMLEAPAEFYGDEYNEAIRGRLGSTSPNALYIEEPELEAYYARLRDAGVRIVDPLAERPWGQSEFTVEDHAGNWLTFWAATAAEAS
jgi:uncharacterized glyoxalase superfamily protein PhnB